MTGQEPNSSRGNLLLAASCGLVLAVAHSTLQSLWNGLAGNFLLEVGIMGLVAGLLASSGRHAGHRFPPSRFPMALILLALATLPVTGRTEPGGAAFLATGGLFLFLMSAGRLAPLEREDVSGTIARGGAFLLALAGGLLAGGLALPWGGPLLLCGLTVFMSLPRGESLRKVLPPALAAAMVFGAMWLLRPTPGPVEPGSESPAAEVRWQRWRADGIDTVVSTRHARTRTTIAGGSYHWYTPIKREEGRRSARKRPVSVELVDLAVGRGTVLALGPASGAGLYRSAKVMGKRQVTLLGDGRVAAAYSASLKAAGWEGSRRMEEETTVPGLRSFLAGTDRKFDVVYYVDIVEPELLRGEGASHAPAFHLTVEGMSLLLQRLESSGWLVYQGPYGLKVVSLLKQIEGGERGALADSLLVYGKKGDPHDLVVFRKAPLGLQRVIQLNRLARAEGYKAFYWPGMAQGENAVRSLVETFAPKGLYAAGTSEFTPPIDDRPFFYHARKLLPRTRKEGEAAMSPQLSERLLGVMPVSEVPWVVFLVLAGLPWLVMFLRRKSTTAEENGGREWRHRFYVFFVLLGLSLGTFAQMAVAVMARDSLVPGLVSLGGAALALAAVSVGLMLGARHTVKPGRGLELALWLVLPAALLPLAAAPLLESAAGARGWFLLLPSVLIPALAMGGSAAACGLRANAAQGSFSPGPAVAVMVIGALAGREWAGPVSLVFGLPFGLVLSWVVMSVAFRILRRIPAGPA